MKIKNVRKFCLLILLFIGVLESKGGVLATELKDSEEIVIVFSQYSDEKKWEDEIEKCYRENIPYTFSIITKAKSVEEAENEAKKILEMIEQYNVFDPIFLEFDELSYDYGAGEDLQSSIVNTFFEIISSTGHQVGCSGEQIEKKKIKDENVEIWEKNGIDYESGEKKILFVWKHFEAVDRPDYEEGGINEQSSLRLLEEKGEKTIEDGWVEAEGKKYYYENGQLYKGEKKINNFWYYFNVETGEMTTGLVNHGSRKVYYSEDGQMQFGEHIIGEKEYYFQKNNGAAYFGLHLKENGKWVYYLERGGKFYGEKRINGEWYYFNEVSGENISGFKKIGNRMLFYDERTGIMKKGEVKIDGKWYLFHPANGAMVTGWHAYPNRRVYYNRNGEMYKGEINIDGNIYLFDSSNGAMITGWHIQNEHKRYYMRTGEMAKGEQKINGNWYYFEEPSGNMAIGFRKIGHRTLYYDLNTGIMLVGEKKIGDKWYNFMPTNGNMRVGMCELGKRTVCYATSGEMLYGQQQIDGEYYFFYESNGAMAKGVWIQGEYYDVEGKKRGENKYFGKKMSLMGDSVSTFSGWIQGGNIARYPQLDFEGGVNQVEQTWWKSLIDDLGMEFGINASSVGATMTKSAETYLAKQEIINQLDDSGTPDVIFVFSGINDLDSHICPFKMGNYEELEIGKENRIIDAFATGIFRIKETYPNAEIVIVLPYYCSRKYPNTKLEIFRKEMQKVCDSFQVKSIDLTQADIKKEDLADGVHPTVIGMKKIKQYIEKQLCGIEYEV